MAHHKSAQKRIRQTARRNARNRDVRSSTRTLVLSVFLVSLGIHHVWRYAQKVKADPSRSLVADIEKDPSWKVESPPQFTFLHGTVIALV